MSLGPLYVLLEEVSVEVFCPFFNWVFCLPEVESCDFFMYFGDQALVRGIIGRHVFFWALYSVPLIYVSVLMPVSDCFDYSDLVI